MKKALQNAVGFARFCTEHQTDPTDTARAMRTWHNRQVPAAVYDYLEEHRCSFGEAVHKHSTLATIAREPLTIEAVNRARYVAGKDRWRELCYRWEPTDAERAACAGILNTMPGYCCLNDAAQLAARL